MMQKGLISLGKEPITVTIKGSHVQQQVDKYVKETIDKINLEKRKEKGVGR